MTPWFKLDCDLERHLLVIDDVPIAICLAAADLLVKEFPRSFKCGTKPYVIACSSPLKHAILAEGELEDLRPVYRSYLEMINPGGFQWKDTEGMLVLGFKPKGDCKLLTAIKPAREGAACLN